VPGTGHGRREGAPEGAFSFLQGYVALSGLAGLAALFLLAAAHAAATFLAAILAAFHPAATLLAALLPALLGFLFRG